MQHNLLWSGHEYHSLENCLVGKTAGGVKVVSVILGNYGGFIYRVDYELVINSKWEAVLLKMKTQFGDKLETLQLEHDGRGNWKENGLLAERLKGCIDVDISLTPLTNTPPINRLRLSEGDGQEIVVAYINVLDRCVQPARQKYTRLAFNRYRFEDASTNFQADIFVDGNCFVTDYPLLFEQTAVINSAYTF